MADKRPYAKIDVGYLSNPKIAAIIDDNPRAVLLHLACINYGVQHATDGVVPVRIAMRIACGTQCDVDLLTQCGLLLDLGDGNVEVRDFLEHQRSAAEVKMRSQAAIDAASARWDAERKADRNADRMPKALPNAMQREKERDTYFDEWWTEYPRKVAKPKAEKAWQAAIKVAEPSTLIAAAKAYASERKGADPKFTAYPASWLNAQRWLDEPAEPEGLTVAQQMGWC